MITVEQIKDIILNDLKKEERHNQLFKKLKEATKQFEGKPISKRIATAFQKALGDDYTVSYSFEYGMYYIRVWPKNNYNARVDFHIGYDSTPVYNFGSWDKQHSGIEYYCTSMGHYAEERIKERQALLDNTEQLNNIVKVMNAYLEAKEKLEEFDSTNTPSYYSIMELLDK